MIDWQKILQEKLNNKEDEITGGQWVIGVVVFLSAIGIAACIILFGG